MVLSGKILEELYGIPVRFEHRSDEKRKALRLPFGKRCPVEFNREQTNCLVREISATGLSLLSPKAIAWGEEFSVYLPRVNGPPIQMVCASMRCAKQTKESIVYLVGAAYIDMVDPKNGQTSCLRSVPAQQLHSEAQSSTGIRGLDRVVPGGQSAPAPSDLDLAALIAAWPSLPEALRAGIIAMTKSAVKNALEKVAESSN